MLLRLAVQGKQKFFLASTSEVFGKNPKERWTEEDDLHLGATSHPSAVLEASTAARKQINDEFLALRASSSQEYCRVWMWWWGGSSTWSARGRWGITAW